MDFPGTTCGSSQPARIQLVVCLGNPGVKYAGTRHNAGFLVADQLQAVSTFDAATLWQPARGELRSLTLYGFDCLLLRPLAYMNNSGEVVKEVTARFGFSPAELIVVSDCLDMPLGRLRIRPGGSSGGQKGVESIIRHLETGAFPRFRIGIGRPQSTEVAIIDYVLAQWTSAEHAVVRQVVVVAANLVATALKQGLATAMNLGNSWSADNINASEKGEPNVEKA